MPEGGRVAINVCDLTQLAAGKPGEPQGAWAGNVAIAQLLRLFCSSDSEVVQIDRRRWDASAVVLDGPGAQKPEHVDSLLRMLQGVIGPRHLGRRVRCYREGPRGGWREIRDA